MHRSHAYTKTKSTNSLLSPFANSGGKVQRASFCTNGGTCKTDTDSNPDGHVGCDCPTAFEGEYCEYEKGLNLTHHYEAAEKPKSEVASIVYGAVWIAMLSGIVFSILFVIVAGCRQRKKDMDNAAIQATSDLSLDPDGATLKEAGSTGTSASTDYEPPETTLDADVQFA